MAFVLRISNRNNHVLVTVPQRNFAKIIKGYQTPTDGGKPEIAPLKLTPSAKWTPLTKRVGLIGRKVGMMAAWDAQGVRIPLTVLRVEKCQVTNITHDVAVQGGACTQVQIGAGHPRVKRMYKSILAHCLKAGADPKKRFMSWNVEPHGAPALGTEISARHFVPGQFIDIQSTTKSKGFQGAMKKWGFGGQPASHGVSLAHRSIGATGARQDPGRVWKGKKMAGLMGGETKTEEGKLLYKIDVARNLLFVKGSVSGPIGEWVRVSDAKWKKFRSTCPPPYPTFVPQPGGEEVHEIVMDVSTRPDPFLPTA